ncbi:hypothetical protein ABVK25_004401 [Lepraria finkii]|uniref:Prokaryotic-type class I peptide chain release factors domain-containing protein n=1 Tax=Lepraria finkii TaxID=1340010 RepID=A0ABR4BB26_9LECA
MFSLNSCRMAFGVIRPTRPAYLVVRRSFTSSNALAAARLPPRMVIKEEDIKEAFLKGSGPGGQKINKTSSAVQLKHIPTGTVIKSQATRSRSQNRKIARRIIAEKIEEAEKGPESRVALKAGIKSKKKASKSKKAKRKYRALQEEKDDQEEEEGVGMKEPVEEPVKEERE